MGTIPIEAALAHQDPNAIRRAYNRTTYWKERTTLVQSGLICSTFSGVKQTIRQAVADHAPRVGGFKSKSSYLRRSHLSRASARQSATTAQAVRWNAGFDLGR